MTSLRVKFKGAMALGSSSQSPLALPPVQVKEDLRGWALRSCLSTLLSRAGSVVGASVIGGAELVSPPHNC